MSHDSIFKQPGSSVFWCRLPNPAGGRHIRESTGQRDRAAAIIFWRRRCRELASGTDTNAPEEVTLSAALTRRVVERRDVKRRAAGTINSLQKKARQLVRLLGHDLLLSQLTSTLVDKYISTRVDEDIQPSTIAKELSALRGAMKQAIRDGKACPLPERVLPVDYSPEYQPRSRALSEREVDALLQELPPHRAAVVAFIASTSATYPSEVQNAVRADVDERRWFVRVRGTKRAWRDRRIPVPGFAQRWLTFALRHARKTGTLFAPWPSVRRDLHAACARLSLCDGCRERLRHRGPGKTVQEECRMCKRVTPFAPCSPNDLRRTLATLLRARGVEPQLIAPILGHRDSRMVERVYGRIAPESLAELIAAQIARGQAGGKPGPKRAKTG